MPNPTTAAELTEFFLEHGWIFASGLSKQDLLGETHMMAPRQAAEELAKVADAYARQQVEAFRERAYKVLCQRCRNNEAVVFANPFPSVPETLGWHHVEKGGAMGGEDLWHDCAAAAIRALEP